jgi:hypothetical protein
MQENPQRRRGRDSVLSTLDTTIEALNLAKDICGITPARVAFASVSALLTMIRVCSILSFDDGRPVQVPQESVVNEQDCVDLGLSCADVCKALNRGLKGRRLDELSQSLLEAIQQLTM